jgi:hypothetical protein
MLVASQTRASDVRVFVLAPTPPQSLANVELHGADKPRFSHSYDIPYKSLQLAAQKEMVALATAHTIGDVVKCDDACPDIHWKLNVAPTLTFVDQAQPVIKAFGDPQANGVDVSLKTKVRLQLGGSARIWAELATGDVGKTEPIALDVTVNVEIATKLNLWPAVAPQPVACAGVSKDPVPVCVRLTLVDSNVALTGLHGEALAAGAGLGLTTISMFTGDPLSGLALGLLGAGKAEKAAKAYVQTQVDSAANDLLKSLSTIATKVGSDKFVVVASAANAIKDQLLATKVPQIDKSYQDLSSALGLTFDIQTTTPTDDVNIVVTPRFAASGAGKIVGKLRLPKDGCVTVGDEQMTIPTGLIPVNNDLVAKIGAQCMKIFSSGDLGASGYLGANPQAAKVGGAALPNWKPRADVTFTGMLRTLPHKPAPNEGSLPSKFIPNGVYECDFEATNASPAEIVQFSESMALRGRMPGYNAIGEASRHLQVSAAGVHASLDGKWRVETDGLVVGGEGYCEPAHTSIPRYRNLGLADIAKLIHPFDPGNCAVCGIKLEEGMLRIKNIAPVLEKNPNLNGVYNALKRGDALPSPSQAAAPAAAPAPLQTRAPVGRAPLEKSPAVQAPVQQAPIQAPVQQAPIRAPQMQGPAKRMLIERPQ